MIDLHLHTTASDGRHAPEELVRRAWGAGVTTLSVTDHDTMAAAATVAQRAAAYGLTAVPGIEITAVHDGRDVHVLGYFLQESSELADFLGAQRDDRVRRVQEMADRLAALGRPIDVKPFVEAVRYQPGRSIGRPQIARALLDAGHVTSLDEAFDRFIGEGRPAYVRRRGKSPEEVIAIVGRASGISSLAHPGLLRRDDLIRPLAAAGLVALEAVHSEHPPDVQQHYRALARELGLAISGGSDYHGDSQHHPARLGAVGISQADFDALSARRPG